MVENFWKTTLWRKGGSFIFFVVSLGLPFLFQKLNLDATRGGWRPEQANYTEGLLALSFMLPFIAVAILPFAQSARLILGLGLAPALLFAFSIFTISYACNNYNGYCF